MTASTDPAFRPEKIISGGQTGVDRAALDVAIDLGIEHGGWCPRGRRSEDGTIPAVYVLTETDRRDYRTRTQWNVRDADATLILWLPPMGSGTALTLNTARRSGTPWMDGRLDAADIVKDIRRWLSEHRPRVLNVAGPRDDDEGTVYRMTREVMRSVLVLPT